MSKRIIRPYSFEKKRRQVFALFKSIFLRNQSLSNASWFYNKKHKIGKGNLYLLENWLSRNKMCCAADNHNCMCHMWCDQAKSVWSRSNSVFIFPTNCMFHFYSYILQKTPLKLINWFQRYEQLKNAKNNRKQKIFSALFGSILKSIFPTSDWFCLITSHMCKVILDWTLIKQ